MRVIVSFSEVKRSGNGLQVTSCTTASDVRWWLRSIDSNRFRLGLANPHRSGAVVALMAVALLVDAVRFWFRRSGEHRRQPRCECIAQHGSVRLHGLISVRAPP
jgi:hypothetical protein